MGKKIAYDKTFLIFQTVKKPHEPPFRLNPFSEDYQQTRKKEEYSRQWIVKPLKEFFKKSFNQLKNW